MHLNLPRYWFWHNGFCLSPAGMESYFFLTCQAWARHCQEDCFPGHILCGSNLRASKLGQMLSKLARTSLWYLWYMIFHTQGTNVFFLIASICDLEISKNALIPLQCCPMHYCPMSVVEDTSLP